MAQFVLVRFIHPETGEGLSEDIFTVPRIPFTRANHTPSHREAIELALEYWSGSPEMLKEIAREDRVDSITEGALQVWRYIYDARVKVAPEADDLRWIKVALFAEYKENTPPS